MAAIEQLAVSPENEAFIRALIRSLRGEANRLARELRKALGDKPRQRRAKILALHSQGKTPRQIADAVCLSVEQVRGILASQPNRNFAA